MYEKKTTPTQSLTSLKWYREFTRFVQLKGLRERSQATYLGWVTQLAAHYPDAPVPRLSPGKVLDFLVHLQADRKLKPSTLNQAVCALRTLYRDHLGRDWDIWKKIKIRREEPLPHVLTREEVARLLGTFRDARYRAYFTVVYQCGLRMSEALHIKPKDIDGERLLIRVVEGKGGKQREVPITPELLARLRRFWASHRNPEWLFPGTGRGWKSSCISLREALHACPHAMTKASVWTAIKVAKAECGLSRTHEKLSIHTLRHSYATHMLEAGTSVRQLAAYLGHSSLKPVMVYLHLTEISEQRARQALSTLATSC
ncbi:MAG: site-specific integrase [Pseudomonadota bacterium]